MLMNRRALLAGLTASACWPEFALAGQSAPPLFWLAKPSGAPPAILFAYDRVAASAVKPVTDAGEGYAARAHRLVVDVPNARLRGQAIDLTKAGLTGSGLTDATAKRLEDLLRPGNPKLPPVAKLPGIIIPGLLLSEGKAPIDANSGGTVGGLIADRAQFVGKPVSYLASFDEFAGVFHSPDLSGLGHDGVEKAVEYLLDLRAKVGPIGRYTDALYADGKIEELWRLEQDASQHGATVLDMLNQMWRSALPTRICDRAVEAIKSAKRPVFVMLAYPEFVRQDGVLQKLRDAGVPISPQS